MRDEAIATAPRLSASEAAVNYLLKRMRVDVDLRHYMLHTEAFRRLCEAEAARIGSTAEAVEDIFSELAPHCVNDKPQVVEKDRQLDRINEILWEGKYDQPEDVLKKITAIVEK